jgi:hypothetical protein
MHVANVQLDTKVAGPKTAMTTFLTEISRLSSRTKHLLAMVLIASGARPASAQTTVFTGGTISAPQLIANISKYIAAHPGDPRGYYIMGRVQGMAYVNCPMNSPYLRFKSDWVFAATSTSMTPVVETRYSSSDPERVLPSLDESTFWRYLVPTRTPQELMLQTAGALPLPSNYAVNPGYRRLQPRPSPQALKYLRESIRYFAKAVELNPASAANWLGYAWALEEGTPYADELGSPGGREAVNTIESTGANWLARTRVALLMASKNSEMYMIPFHEVNIKNELALSRLRLKSLSEGVWTEDDENQLGQILNTIADWERMRATALRTFELQERRTPVHLTDED